MKDLHEAGLRGRMPIFIAKFLININIKINSIMKCLGNGIDGSLYVDDFLICYQSKQMNTIQRHLQLCLNKIRK